MNNLVVKERPSRNDEIELMQEYDRREFKSSLTFITLYIMMIFLLTPRDYLGHLKTEEKTGLLSSQISLMMINRDAHGG